MPNSDGRPLDLLPRTPSPSPWYVVAIGAIAACGSGAEVIPSHLRLSIGIGSASHDGHVCDKLALAIVGRILVADEILGGA